MSGCEQDIVWVSCDSAEFFSSIWWQTVLNMLKNVELVPEAGSQQRIKCVSTALNSDVMSNLVVILLLPIIHFLVILVLDAKTFRLRLNESKRLSTGRRSLIRCLQYACMNTMPRVYNSQQEWSSVKRSLEHQCQQKTYCMVAWWQWGSHSSASPHILYISRRLCYCESSPHLKSSYLPSGWKLCSLEAMRPDASVQILLQSSTSSSCCSSTLRRERLMDITSQPSSLPRWEKLQRTKEVALKPKHGNKHDMWAADTTNITGFGSDTLIAREMKHWWHLRLVWPLVSFKTLSQPKWTIGLVKSVMWWNPHVDTTFIAIWR